MIESRRRPAASVVADVCVVCVVEVADGVVVVVVIVVETSHVKQRNASVNKRCQ